MLVSRGSRGGLLVNQKLNVKLSARSRPMATVNTVGAGDALVAAVVRQIELGNPPGDWLRWGVATGTAATQCAAGKLPPATLVEQLGAFVKVS